MAKPIGMRDLKVNSKHKEAMETIDLAAKKLTPLFDYFTRLMTSEYRHIALDNPIDAYHYPEIAHSEKLKSDVRKVKAARAFMVEIEAEERQ